MKTDRSLKGRLSTKNILTALFISSFLAPCSFVRAQDIHFAQLTEAPLFLNPANAGVFDGYFRAALNYRSQWNAMGQPYKTMAASVDGVIGEKKDKKGYIGWGLSVFNDQAGASAYALNQVLGSFNGIVNLNDQNKFCVAISSGFGQRSANYTALTFGNQYNGETFDPTIPSFETIEFNKFSYAEANAGLLWEFKKTSIGFDRDDNFDLKVGVAGYHLNQPPMAYSKYAKEKLPMRLVGEITARIDIKGTKLTLVPTAVYMRQATFSEMNLGTFLRVRFKNPTKTTGFKHDSGISFGGFIRPGDAIIPQMMIDFNGFSVGFAYDYNISSFKTATRGNGGMEVSLQWHSLRDALFKRVREFSGGRGSHNKPTP